MFDIYYFILVVPMAIFALVAQGMVKSAYSKYAQVPTTRGLSGCQVAELILKSAGIYDVTIEAIAGELTDHYDPKAKVLRLSEGVYNHATVAACGIAAHEAGHAVQHATGYAPLYLRNQIITATRIGSSLSMPLIFAGIIIAGFTSQASDLSYYIIMAGIALFGLSVIFQVLTLPVEFNASRRAISLLGSQMILTQQELEGAKAVLRAAALTYVAAMAQAIASLLRLLLLFGRRSRD